MADRSETTEPCTARGDLLRFEPIEAKHVRITVTKSSANAYVHLVELKVFRQGAAWTAPPESEDDGPGFVSLFNGQDLTGWRGDDRNYVAQFGKLVCLESSHMNIFSEKEYGDFVLRFDFKLSPGANNGLGIRTPFMGHAAYDGMELQIIDDYAPQFQDLHEYQFHGAIYGVLAPKRGHLKPAGHWNRQEVIAQGLRITVNLNGVPIIDADLSQIEDADTPDDKEHPGLKNPSGCIAFLGHGAHIEFRNIRIKEL